MIILIRTVFGLSAAKLHLELQREYFFLRATRGSLNENRDLVTMVILLCMQHYILVDRSRGLAWCLGCCLNVKELFLNRKMGRPAIFASVGELVSSWYLSCPTEAADFVQNRNHSRVSTLPIEPPRPVMLLLQTGFFHRQMTSCTQCKITHYFPSHRRKDT